MVDRYGRDGTAVISLKTLAFFIRRRKQVVFKGIRERPLGQLRTIYAQHTKEMQICSYFNKDVYDECA